MDIGMEHLNNSRRTSGLPGAIYDVRLKLNVLFVKRWGLRPHTPASILCKGYLIMCRP